MDTQYTHTQGGRKQIFSWGARLIRKMKFCEILKFLLYKFQKDGGHRPPATRTPQLRPPAFFTLHCGDIAMSLCDCQNIYT